MSREETLTPALVESWFTHEWPDAFRAAIGSALWAGWLMPRDGGWRVTAVGSEVGRH
jgi:hypothetical protein